jgi:hypothetical protein
VIIPKGNMTTKLYSQIMSRKSSKRRHLALWQGKPPMPDSIDAIDPALEMPDN